jgi:hypothetical protein
VEEKQAEEAYRQEVNVNSRTSTTSSDYNNPLGIINQKAFSSSPPALSLFHSNLINKMKAHYSMMN